MKTAVTVLAALLVVLTLATAAGAACAWALWMTEDGPAAPWKPLSYHETRSECWRRITDSTLVQPEGSWSDTIGWLLQTEGYKRWVRSRIPDGASAGGFMYRCLPETVDPRGPKASGR